jgi:hypothetical protein
VSASHRDSLAEKGMDCVGRAGGLGVCEVISTGRRVGGSLYAMRKMMRTEHGAGGECSVVLTSLVLS